MHHSTMVFRETADGVLVAPPTCGLLTVPDLVSHVRAWCASGHNQVLVVDLSEVEHLDVAAFRALVWSQRQCTSAGRELAVVLPPPGVLAREQRLALQSLAPGSRQEAVEPGPGPGETPEPLLPAG